MKTAFKFKRGAGQIIAFLILFVVFGSIAGVVFIFINQDRATAPQAATRDMYKWPFDKNSPWNMPIGSSAQLAPADLGNICGQGIQTGCSGPKQYFSETEWVYMDPTAPVVTLYDNNGWPAKCGGGTQVSQVRIRNGARIPGGSSSYFPNNTGGAISASNPEEVQEYFASCRDGDSSIFAYGAYCKLNLKGSGVGSYCSHGGSGLSAVGGSLRQWEFAAGTPIRHALKVTLPAATLSGNISGQSAICDNGYRWPAITADSGWNAGTDNKSRYSGQNPDVCMGSLLAIPQSVNCDTLVSQDLSKRICAAMRDYGAYIVDIHPTDSYWRPYTVNIEGGFDDPVDDNDMYKLFPQLHVVKNNGQSSIGGGGTPRVPLAPDFGETIPSAAPTTAPTVAPTSTPSPLPTQQPIVSTSIEGEAMKINSGYVNSSGNIFNDSSASGGKGLSLLSNGNASGTVNAGFNTVKVKARADLCFGAPTMNVKVDGKTVMTRSVSSTSWGDISVGGLNYGAGNHTIAVEFTNDSNPGSCDRNLRIDKVSVETASAGANRCDFNGDGRLSSADQGLLANAYGKAPAGSANSKYDLNGEGNVNSADQGILAQGISKYPTKTQYCY